MELVVAAILTIVADQASKMFVLTRFAEGQFSSSTFLIRIRRVTNPRAASFLSTSALYCSDCGVSRFSLRFSQFALATSLPLLPRSSGWVWLWVELRATSGTCYSAMVSLTLLI